MTERSCIFFVWSKTIRGPAPLKVCAGPDDEPHLEKRLRKHVLASHRLHKHEETLSFPQLEALYPPPKEVLS